MALTWLTYNGSTVGLTSHAGYGLGFDSTPRPSPRPIMGDGIVRFQFADTSITQSTLESISTPRGVWTPVRDENTGLDIPGMWDYAYDRNQSLFNQNFPNGITTALNIGTVEIVDIKDSNPPGSGYWQEGFKDDTAITKVNITQYANSAQMLRMFDGCTSLTEAHVECGTAKTESMFFDCDNLQTLYISTRGGLYPTPFAGCTSLRELTIETTDASSGWFFGDDNQTTLVDCENSIQEITLIHPDTATMTLVGGIGISGDETRLFDSCAYLRHVTYVKRITDQSSPRYGELDADRMPIRGSGDIQMMFRGCSSLEAIPPLIVRSPGTLSNVNYMFQGCRKVRSGISAAYDVLLAANPSQHVQTFTHCGVDTAHGLAELQTIPTSWGGLAIP